VIAEIFSNGMAISNKPAIDKDHPSNIGINAIKDWMMTPLAAQN